MKFYNRENEIKLLQDTSRRSTKSSKMTIVVGRRRVGKTSLILEAFKQSTFLYLFVSKKSESLLCADFIYEIENQLKFKVYGEIKSFSVLFNFLMEQSKNNPFTLVIDEFQEFYTINPSLYSEIQKIWDLNKATTKMHVIFSGSVYSLMTKIFQNIKEPLFGRADEKIFLKSFDVNTLKNILKDHNPNYKNEDLLALYAITNGVAKYVALFMDKNCTDLEAMLNEIYRNNSLLLDEGKNVLVDDFGKDYTTYFSILSLISSSKTSRTDMESILEKSIGPYLEKLETDFNIIKSVKPIFAKPNSRKQKYYIEDNFLKFWFRYVYKYKSAVEISNFEYLKNIVRNDFSVFSGKILEKYFTEKMILTNQFSAIGAYWETNNLNEIDIVAVNDNEKKAVIAEVKLNKSKISVNVLQNKSVKLIENNLQYYDIEYKSLSVADM
jgi:hypothetical protein